MRISHRVLLWALLLTASGAPFPLGCAPAVSEGGFDAPDPASKLYAIVRAGERKDREAIPKLIEQLESDDQAVRMYAIQALKRITGKQFGYRYYEPAHKRQAAIERWVEAYRESRLTKDQGTGAKPSISLNGP